MLQISRKIYSDNRSGKKYYDTCQLSMKGLSYRLNRAPLMSLSRDFIDGNDVHIFMLMIP